MKPRGIRTVIWLATVPLVLVVAFWLIGQVDYDTHPTASVPSRSTEEIKSDLDLKEGGRWAESNGIVQHQKCKAKFGHGLRALGCHRYVTAQKQIPPLRDWRTQPTSSTCVTMTRAHYEPMLQDLIEQGEDHAASVLYRKQFAPDLHQCQNIDNLRIVKIVHEPLGRLTSALTRARQGHVLTEDELEQLRRDIPLVEEFHPHPMRTRYLEMSDELFASLGGRERVFPLTQKRMSSNTFCEDMARQVVEQKKAYHEAIAAYAHEARKTANLEGQSTRLTQQNDSLEAWTKAAIAHLQAGCPPLR